MKLTVIIVIYLVLQKAQSALLANGPHDISIPHKSIISCRGDDICYDGVGKFALGFRFTMKLLFRKQG